MFLGLADRGGLSVLQKFCTSKIYFVKKVPAVLYSLHFWKSTDGTGTRYRYSVLFKRKILHILETIFSVILCIEQWLSLLLAYSGNWYNMLSE